MNSPVSSKQFSVSEFWLSFFSQFFLQFQFWIKG